ncbi:MAG: hypothetical protein O2818_07340 [Bacteroidetes bacterium]|nr:hypothetical protein [Bacteroidota bacterium]MDA1336683.1 hypothetical protein [Bacteroidota bacterium]
MRNHIIGICVLLIMTGCSVQKESFLAGFAVASHQGPAEPAPVISFQDPRPDVRDKNSLATQIEILPEAIEKGECSPKPPAANSSKSIRMLPARKKLPEQVGQFESIQQKSAGRVSEEVDNQIEEQGEIPIDRNLGLTLLTIGAAAMMWGYTSFSLLGFLLVFLASLAFAPAVHSLIWKEPLNWQKSRFGRIALSMVLSGLVLSGIVAMLANFLGWVF